jgi:cellobiose-specific phosphotransferase system component IIB
MLGDIQIYDDGVFGNTGVRTYAVASGTTANKINAGEPVFMALDQIYVTALATGYPTSASQATTILGIAATTSTDTASAAGKVDVLLIDPNATYICKGVDTTYGYVAATGVVTQATYDALVGQQVYFTLTGTAAAKTATYTVAAAAGTQADNGLVVEPLDIVKHPGMVRFSFRPTCTSRGWATGNS